MGTAGIIEKTPQERRRPPGLPRPAHPRLLRRNKTDVAEQLFKVGFRVAGDTFVFSTTPDYSEPHKPPSVTQKYRLMAIRLRMRSTRLHALRHYSATELLAAGVDLRTVAGRLGHGDGTTTLRTYAAWVAAADRRAAEQMAEIMPVVTPLPPKPLGPYQTIADALREDIRSGRLKPADQLPTVVQLPRSTRSPPAPRTALWRPSPPKDSSRWPAASARRSRIRPALGLARCLNRPDSDRTEPPD